MRSFEIETLTLPCIREIYARRMGADFPPDEIKPLGVIERALARGEYVCYGATAGGELLAYAFFAQVDEPGGTVSLFDYYAVRADLRGQGVGGRFLKALMAGPLRDKACVLLEVDDPDFAPTPAERAVCERRLRFYLSNGLRDTGVTAEVYGVAFRVLALPVGAMPDPAETRRVYAAVYRAMLAKEVFDSKVRIF